jgi:hypothetical protein
MQSGGTFALQERGVWRKEPGCRTWKGEARFPAEANKSPMKRTLYIILALALVFTAVWIGGSFRSVAATYTVTVNQGGDARFSLTVPSPGLFVDIAVPEGAAPLRVTAGGRPAPVVKPWPGSSNRRVLALWRGPVEVVLAEGAGPFRLADLPVPARGAASGLTLPEGWRQVGRHAGRLTTVVEGPLTVAVPEGVQLPPEALDRVQKLYAAVAKLTGTEPVRAPALVLTTADPAEAALAVIDLWMPAYDADAYWWQKGAPAFYTARLLDQTGLWTPTEETRWQKEHSKDKEYMIVLWVDASIRLASRKQRSLDDMLADALSLRTHAELLAAVREAGGLSTADKLDRMLRGREPLPSTDL